MIVEDETNCSVCKRAREIRWSCYCSGTLSWTLPHVANLNEIENEWFSDWEKCVRETNSTLTESPARIHLKMIQRWTLSLTGSSSVQDESCFARLHSLKCAIKCSSTHTNSIHYFIFKVIYSRITSSDVSYGGPNVQSWFVIWTSVRFRWRLLIFLETMSFSEQ